MPSVALFEIDDTTYRNLQRVLDSRQLKQAVYQVVSRTTRKAAQIATRAVADKLPIPRKYIIGKNRHAALTVKIVKGDRPEGRITIKPKQLPLSAFKYRQTKRGGTTVTIEKDQPAQTFRHAFVAKVRSQRQEEQGVSHTGIFVRQKVDTANATRYFQKNKTSFFRAAKARAITPKGYAWRLPIAELFGPTVLDFISRSEISTAIYREIGDFRDRQIDSQIARFTQGRATSLADALLQIGVTPDTTDQDTDAAAA